MTGICDTLRTVLYIQKRFLTSHIAPDLIQCTYSDNHCILQKIRRNCYVSKLNCITVQINFAVQFCNNSGEKYIHKVSY